MSLLTASALALLPMLAISAQPPATVGVTSLSNSQIDYTVSKTDYAVLKRGPITAVIVNNEAVDTQQLAGHRAGYSGVAALLHEDQPRNLFVPNYAGLNFEHIHDGTTSGLKEKFEPRKFPMQLRLIDEHCVELYQPPTGNWQLESCGRYELLEDGVIQYTFQCVPRANDYRQKFIGLFWASYINAPEEKSIHFQGRRLRAKTAGKWLETWSPKHGVESTHPPTWAATLPPVDSDFPLTLVNHPSPVEYTEPWYYGVNDGFAFAQMFRRQDNVWFAQSPTGGGATNPAWDFQWFIRDVKVGQVYGFVMRAAYVPFQGREKLNQTVSTHLKALK